MKTFFASAIILLALSAWGSPASPVARYWLPFYDNVNMVSSIVVSGTQAANFDIYIGGVLKGSYSVPVNGVSIQSYPGVQGGPVKIVSNANLLASQRVFSSGGYSELPFFPEIDLSTEYRFPYYDHGYPNTGTMRTWIGVGNTSHLDTALVNIYVGGSLMSGSPFSILPGAIITPRWIGLQGGPVRVVSTNDVTIFATQRVFTATANAFGEMSGQSVLLPRANIPATMHNFIIMGQSNAVGYAPIPAPTTHTGVYTFGNDYSWHNATNVIDSAIGTVDPVTFDQYTGYGFGISFAETYRTISGADVGLIPCARAGMPISELERNLSDDSMYGACLKRARAAGGVDGILFYQGEANATSTTLANGWAAAFEQFVDDLRADLGYDVPVVFAQLATTSKPQYVAWSTVKAEQASVDKNGVAMVPTDDLPLLNDPHLSVSGYDTLGRERMADAMWELQP